MASEMPGQDGLRPGIESEAVLGPHEAVALVREQRIGHREALRIEGCDPLVGLGLLHPGGGGALRDQEGRPDPAGSVNRRARTHQVQPRRGVRIADRPDHLRAERLPVRGLVWLTRTSPAAPPGMGVRSRLVPAIDRTDVPVLVSAAVLQIEQRPPALGPAVEPDPAPRIPGRW